MEKGRNRSQEQHENALQYIRLLAALAHVDDELKNEEMRFIISVAEKLNITEKEVHNLLDDQHSKVTSTPKSEQERMSILYHLLFMMKIDGEVSQSEKDLILKIGVRLGIRPDLVTELSSIFEQYIDKTIPPNLLLDCIRKYLN